jgi:ankyrin repeat protein
LAKEHGADVNQVDPQWGSTTLILAAEKGHVAIVRCLIKELGADVHKGDESGFSAVFVAINYGQMAVARFLINEFGADVNQGNRDGCTPLYKAALEGKVEVVLALVTEMGADVNQADHGGSTLHVAAERGNLDVVRASSSSAQTSTQQMKGGAQCLCQPLFTSTPMSPAGLSRTVQTPRLCIKSTPRS